MRRRDESAFASERCGPRAATSTVRLVQPPPSPTEITGMSADNDRGIRGAEQKAATAQKKLERRPPDADTAPCTAEAPLAGQAK